MWVATSRMGIAHGGTRRTAVTRSLSLGDYSAGLVAALGLMIALFDAQRVGQGRDVDTSHPSRSDMSCQ
ncbi:MAG: CoA transferase [Chloroflexota bacterium]